MYTRTILNRTKLLLSALSAALILSAAITTAHARRFETSNQRIRAVWSRGAPLEFPTALGTVRCSLTAEGSFHSRIISKVSGALIGYITSAAVARPCTGGEAWVQNGSEQFPNGERPTSLPWHIRYDSFTGALPNITRVRLQLVGAGFLVRISTTGCLYSGTSTRPSFGFAEREAGDTVTGFTPDPTARISPLIRLEGIVNCPEGQFEGGPAAITQLGSDTTKIRVRLVQ